jgi:Fe-S cluster biogenesis protein NfuA/nitrite reductase/ring-hydroxylating ferredoxin subunit
MDDHQARERVAAVEALLDETETLPDPGAREHCTELVAELLALYGEALERLVRLVPQPGALRDDELVSHLMLVHGIHPVPVEERVRGALEEVRPYLESHGGNVELVSVEDGVVGLRLEGSCSGCPSSAATLTLAVEDAIHKAAPEVEEIREITAPGAAAGPDLLQIEPLAPPAPAQSVATTWAMAGGLPQLRSGGVLVKEIAGERVLFCEVDDTAYAYRPGCPGCEASLEDGELRGAELRCTTCGRAYEVTRAGRCAGSPELQLEPIPLLVDDAGLAKVALANAP